MKYTKEELLGIITATMPCTCIPAYKDRGMSAPDCPRCNYADDLADALAGKLEKPEAFETEEK